MAVPTWVLVRWATALYLAFFIEASSGFMRSTKARLSTAAYDDAARLRLQRLRVSEDALGWRFAVLSHGLRFGSPLHAQNMTDTELCTPPVNVSESASASGLSLLHASSSHVLYGGKGENAGSMGFMLYDCKAGKKLVFLHIPKNAGTTIENIALSFNVSWGYRNSELEGLYTLPDNNTCFGWHTPPNYLPASKMYYADNDTDVFCVTRDPWQRMVSEYDYLVSIWPGWKGAHVMDGERCTKEGFNLFVRNSITTMKAGQRWLSGCHMLPQWDYIEDEAGKRMCDHILPLESLTQSFNTFMQQYGLDIRMQPESKANSCTSTCPELAGMDLRDVYDNETLEAMREMYAKDFEHLGDSLKVTLEL